MKGFIGVARIIVGTLFVISGLIKANDPYGFSYKLEEYFAVFETDIGTKKVAVVEEAEEAPAEAGPCADKLKKEVTYTQEPIPESELGFLAKTFISIFKFSAKNAVELAVFICILEILLGVFVIIGYRMNPVSWLLLLMIVFFTFLTFYSAYFNKVTDCGCFGDALKLTPWQSFGKDIFLLVFVIPLFIARKKINGNEVNTGEYIISGVSLALMVALCALQFKWMFPVYFLAGALLVRFVVSKTASTTTRQLVMSLGVLIGSGWFTAHCINHLSVKDYRPWAVGKNIREEAKGEAETSEVNMVYFKKSDCSEVSMPTTEWSWLDSTFEANHIFYKQDKKVIKPGIDAKIKDISFEDPATGMTYADTIFANTGYTFLVIAPKLSKTDADCWDDLNELAAYAAQKNILFLGGTSSEASEIDQFRHTHQIMYPLCLNDEKALKTILRSNPGLVLLKDGVVLQKWHYNDIPDVEDLTEYIP